MPVVVGVAMTVVVVFMVLVVMLPVLVVIIAVLALVLDVFVLLAVVVMVAGVVVVLVLIVSGLLVSARALDPQPQERIDRVLQVRPAHKSLEGVLGHHWSVSEAAAGVGAPATPLGESVASRLVKK